MATITGISGNHRVESVATFAWNRWQPSSGICSLADNSVEFLEPTPYLCFDSTAAGTACDETEDSPFNGIVFQQPIYLENFEDGSLDTPGVTASAGVVLEPGTNPNRDSVDFDDSAIDGIGAGHSFFVGPPFTTVTGADGITFEFNANDLGGVLPTHVGIVWTDGCDHEATSLLDLDPAPATFEAFGPSGTPLGIIADYLGDGAFNGGTAEDRFFGVSNAEGISKIRISDAGCGLEVDHLQYGEAALLFSFAGFFPPVDNLPVLNEVKAGSAIPVKFSLDGDQGLDIFAIGYPRSEQILCGSTVLVDGIEETVTAGSSSLSYDPITDQYNYVWKTDKAWANTCRQLIVKLNDNSTHRANFQFK